MTPRFRADENIDPDLVTGMRRRVDGIDTLQVQEVGLRTIDDPTIRRWAAAEGRVLITRGIKAIPGYASQRLIAGQPMPGVLAIPPGCLTQSQSMTWL